MLLSVAPAWAVAEDVAQAPVERAAADRPSAASPAPAALPDAAASSAVLPAVKVTTRRDSATEGTGSYTAGVSSAATKLELSLRETPQSISIVTRTQMDDFALRSVNDVLADVTGVTVQRVETDRTYYSARGFDISNFQLDGLGLPFATGDQLGDIDTAAYDRVEVLRGANGLMSSTGNPSATVNFVRKRPTAEFQAGARLSLGSWSDRRLDGDVAGPLNASGSVRGRLVLAGQKKNSYLDRYSLEKTVVHGVLEADIAPATVLTVGHTEQHNRPEGNMWGALPLYHSDGTPTRYDVSTSSAADWSYWNTDDVQSFAELTHAFDNGWRAKAVLTRRVIESDAKLFYAYGEPDATTGLGLISYPSKYEHSERQWLGDLYASGPFRLAGRQHELVVGLNASKSDNALRSIDQDVGQPIPDPEGWDGGFPLPAFDADISGRADFVDRRQSLYAAARFNVTDALKLITGLNTTRVESEGSQYGEPHDYDVSKTKPYLGAVLDLDARHSLYASYAGIFYPQGKIDQSRSVLPPVEGSSAEAGVKGEWFGKRLNGQAAVFRVKQDGTAEYAGFANDGGYSFYRGVNATSTGFELDVAGQLAPGWELSAGYAQLRLKDDDGDRALTYVPRKTFRLSTSYQLPAVRGLKLGMALRWQDRIERTDTLAGGADVVTRQGAYALLSLFARHEFSRHWSASVNVNNVTDKRYINSLYWSQNYGGMPRSVNVALAWAN